MANLQRPADRISDSAPNPAKDRTRIEPGEAVSSPGNSLAASSVVRSGSSVYASFAARNTGLASPMSTAKSSTVQHGFFLLEGAVRSATVHLEDTEVGVSRGRNAQTTPDESHLRLRALHLLEATHRNGQLQALLQRRRLASEVAQEEFAGSVASGAASSNAPAPSEVQDGSLAGCSSGVRSCADSVGSERIVREIWGPTLLPTWDSDDEDAVLIPRIPLVSLEPEDAKEESRILSGRSSGSSAACSVRTLASYEERLLQAAGALDGWEEGDFLEGPQPIGHGSPAGSQVISYSESVIDVGHQDLLAEEALVTAALGGTGTLQIWPEVPTSVGNGDLLAEDHFTAAVASQADRDSGSYYRAHLLPSAHHFLARLHDSDLWEHKASIAESPHVADDMATQAVAGALAVALEVEPEDSAGCNLVTPTHSTDSIPSASSRPIPSAQAASIQPDRRSASLPAPFLTAPTELPPVVGPLPAPVEQTTSSSLWTGDRLGTAERLLREYSRYTVDDVQQLPPARGLRRHRQTSSSTPSLPRLTGLTNDKVAIESKRTLRLTYNRILGPPPIYQQYRQRPAVEQDLERCHDDPGLIRKRRDQRRAAYNTMPVKFPMDRIRSSHARVRSEASLMTMLEGSPQKLPALKARAKSASRLSTTVRMNQTCGTFADVTLRAQQAFTDKPDLVRRPRSRPGSRAHHGCELLKELHDGALPSMLVPLF
eukprot:CAMPEP_0172746624 /NCGR_PEP_ID=MMETSP1074-20121228/141095_1 /TAXON_ID=2916 /ORGANISM="Ceratium fusus, Strain PA161109" /LENGTH=712 /DNA_ID=CAMNT_0013578017 /DNA_START=12 /DNA_END=2150 /DNA_ORIENTATION=-